MKDLLLNKLREDNKPLGCLSYSDACCFMYGVLDNENNHVHGIYTNFDKIIENSFTKDFKIIDPKTPNVKLEEINSRWIRSSFYDKGKGINCEHIYPQSQLKHSGALMGVSDLHHMIPANVKINGIRSNYIFGEVDDYKGLFLGQGERDDKSEFDKRKKVFEPCERSKGNIARGVFYIATIYGNKLFTGKDSKKRLDWFQKQIETLKIWNRQDPPDEAEMKRTFAIQKIQGNVNPFIIDHKLIDKLY